MSPKSRRRTTHGTSEIGGPVATLPAQEPVDARAVPVAHVRVPGAGRAADRRSPPPALGRDAEQPGAQHPHLLRAAGGHPLCLSAGPAALSRDPLGQRLSHRRPRPGHLAPPDPALAHGNDAARPHGLAVAVGHVHALDHGLDRLQARRGARHRPLSGGPAGVPRPARNLLGPARHHPVGGQGHQHARHQGCRQRRRIRRSEERPGGPAARHGHGLLVVAAGPWRIAGARLPGAAGQPRPRPLLQPARGMAVRHHRAGAGRVAHGRLCQPPARCGDHRHAPRHHGPQRAAGRLPRAARVRWRTRRRRKGP